jgi:hypothetical protein
MNGLGGSSARGCDRIGKGRGFRFNGNSITLKFDKVGRRTVIMNGDFIEEGSKIRNRVAC